MINNTYKMMEWCAHCLINNNLNLTVFAEGFFGFPQL